MMNKKRFFIELFFVELLIPIVYIFHKFLIYLFKEILYLSIFNIIPFLSSLLIITVIIFLYGKYILDRVFRYFDKKGW